MTKLTDEELHEAEALSVEVRHCGGADYNECDLSALASACLSLLAEVRLARSQALSEGDKAVLREIRELVKHAPIYEGPTRAARLAILDRLTKEGL